MTELHIQKALRSGSTVEDLCKKHGLEARRHGRFNNLILFVYDQLLAKKDDALANQCRGLILDEADNWHVVSYTMDRFFNAGEGAAASIDWKSARAQAKLDGSLAILYNYRGEWHWATKGSPDASGGVGIGNKRTFAKAFQEAFEAHGFNLAGVDPNLVFFFEYTSPENRVVVRYPSPKLTVLGARNRVMLHELIPYWAARTILPEHSRDRPHNHSVFELPIETLEEVVEACQRLKPLEEEGYVIVDGKFNRIKVKSPAYVALHHLRSSFSLRAAVEIVRSGEVDEVLAAFPEWSDILMELRKRFNHAVAETERIYEIHKHKLEQKAFALAVKDLPWAGALFMLRAGKVASVQEYIKKLPIDGACRLLKADDLKAEKVAVE